VAYDLEEQEKLDELKDWWNRNGTLVTAVIVVAALAVLGYRAWNYYQASQSGKAAVLYEQLDKAIAQQQMPLVREITGTMLDRFSGTAYAQMAALAAARANIQAGDPKTAQAQLQWAADHASDPEYRWVAKLRLASVLLDQGLPAEAEKALDGDVPASFAAAFDDRRGDVFAAQGKNDAARTQYQTALTKLDAVGSDVRTAYTNVLQLKLDALGSVPAPLAGAPAPGAAVTGVTPATVLPAPSPAPAAAGAEPSPTEKK
jgi:predicted negative regulator of RcsB-dependent stress response